MCRLLKNQQATRHIPIILMSANRDLRQIVQETGADGVLVKPFDLTDLLKTIESTA